MATAKKKKKPVKADPLAHDRTPEILARLEQIERLLVRVAPAEPETQPDPAGAV